MAESPESISRAAVGRAETARPSGILPRPGGELKPKPNLWARRSSASIGCHPEAAESSALRTTPNEEPALSRMAKGPMHLAESNDAADKSMDPSSRKKRAPQDDRGDRERGRRAEARLFHGTSHDRQDHRL